MHVCAPNCAPTSIALCVVCITRCVYVVWIQPSLSRPVLCCGHTLTRFGYSSGAEANKALSSLNGVELDGERTEGGHC